MEQSNLGKKILETANQMIKHSNFTSIRRPRVDESLLWFHHQQGFSLGISYNEYNKFAYVRINNNTYELV